MDAKKTRELVEHAWTESILNTLEEYIKIENQVSKVVILPMYFSPLLTILPGRRMVILIRLWICFQIG